MKPNVLVFLACTTTSWAALVQSGAHEMSRVGTCQPDRPHDVLRTAMAEVLSWMKTPCRVEFTVRDKSFPAFGWNSRTGAMGIAWARMFTAAENGRHDVSVFIPDKLGSEKFKDGFGRVEALLTPGRTA